MILVDAPLTRDKIVQAIDDAGDGDDIVLPPGRLVLESADDAILVRPGVNIRGSGLNNTILEAGADDMDILRFELTGQSNVTDFGISSMTLNAGNQSGVNGYALYGNDETARCSGIYITKVTFLNCNRGIDLRLCANIFISEVFISGGKNIDGIHVETCTDVDIISSKIQNGLGRGIRLVGGVPGPADEGVRIVGVSTNGQHIGLAVDTLEYLVMSNCSFTTAPGGATKVFGVCRNWKVTGCEFAVAGEEAGQPGFNVVDSECEYFSLTGNQFILNNFGIVLRGRKHTLVGNIFHNNSNVDIILPGARNCIVSGNLADSIGVPWSIVENGSADGNCISGNATHGLLIGAGPNSLIANNHEF